MSALAHAGPGRARLHWYESPRSGAAGPHAGAIKRRWWNGAGKGGGGGGGRRRHGDITRLGTGQGAGGTGGVQL